jgi:hypothetical protein
MIRCQYLRRRDCADQPHAGEGICGFESELKLHRGECVALEKTPRSNTGLPGSVVVGMPSWVVALEHGDMLTTPQPKTVAIHESGHAIFAYAHSIPVVFMTIDQNRAWPPRPSIPPGRVGPITLYDTLAFQTLRHFVLAGLAGIAAQTVFKCEDWPDYPTLMDRSYELQQAYNAVSAALPYYGCTSPEGVDALANQSLQQHLSELVSWLQQPAHSKAVSLLAKKLMARTTLLSSDLAIHCATCAPLQPLIS